MDKKSLIIIILAIILASILSSIAYIHSISSEMESINLNSATIDAPSNVKFNQVNANFTLLNSSDGYFIAEIDNNTDIEKIFDLKGSKVSAQGDNSIYEVENHGKVKYIGVYKNNETYIVVGSPNLNILNEMLNSIEEFSEITLPSSESESSYTPTTSSYSSSGSSSSGSVYQSSDDSSDDFSSSEPEIYSSESNTVNNYYSNNEYSYSSESVEYSNSS